MNIRKGAAIVSVLAFSFLGGDAGWSVPLYSKRSEVPVEDTWNLADIYASQDLWEADLKKAVPLLRISRGCRGM